MPRLTRWFLRAALVNLLAAVALGVLLAWPRGAPGPGALAASGPVYIHLLVVGWLTQLVMGVAWWMFPRQTRTTGGGNTIAGWMIFALLNIGLFLRAVAEPQIAAAHAVSWTRWMIAAAALLQLLAGWLFVLAIWPRVRGR